MISGSRNSSTNRMLILRSYSVVAAHFFHRGVLLAEQGKRSHLLRRLLLADLAHREADVDEHPVADLGRIIPEQSQIDMASHAAHVDQSKVRIVAGDFGDAAGNREAHGGSDEGRRRLYTNGQGHVLVRTGSSCLREPCQRPLGQPTAGFGWSPK